MREDIYKAAIAFLNRVDLKGSEVEAFEAVRAELYNAHKYGIAFPSEDSKEAPGSSKKNAKES